MPYTPTAADFKDIPDTPEGYVPTAADFAPPTASAQQIRADIQHTMESPLDRHIRNLMPGLANPWIQALNLVPGVNIKPLIPEDPHSLMALGGQVEGAIAPFLTGEGAIAAGASQLPKLGEAIGLTGRAISPLTRTAEVLSKPSILRSGLTGGLVGAATSPPGTREMSGLGGAAVAGGAHGIGQLLGTALHALPRTERIQKAASLYEPPLTGDPEDAVKNATDQIASNYIQDLRKSRNLYTDATAAANLHGIKFDKTDFPEYEKVYKELKGEDELPPAIRSPENMIKTDLDDPDNTTILPSTVHQRRSAMLRKGRLTGSGFDRNAYNKLANGLLTDYIVKMDDFDPRLSENYMKANNFYKNTIVGKYRKHAAFQNMQKAIEELPGGQEGEENNLFRIRWHGKTPQNLITKLVPKGEDKNMALLNSFQNDLMKGNEAQTSNAAKNLLFSKYASPLNGPPEAEEIETPHYKFNMFNFLNHYGNLGQNQLDYLFTPEEQKTLNIFDANKKKLKTPGKIQQIAKNALGASIGYLVGAHTLGTGPAKIAGELAGAALAKPLEKGVRGATKAFLPSDLSTLLDQLGPYKPTFRTTRLPAALSLGALQASQNPGGF